MIFTCKSFWPLGELGLFVLILGLIYLTSIEVGTGLDIYVPF